MTTRRGLRSWGPSPDVPPTMRQTLSYLQREPLISNDGCLGPVDDFRERQLPAGAEEHRDAASLGGGAVIGEPSPSLYTFTPPQATSSPPVKGKDKEESIWGGGNREPPSYVHVPSISC